METEQRNRRIVVGFLAGVILFTTVMIFVVGPQMMQLRDTVEEQKLLFKCQSVEDGNHVIVQMRAWEKPNPHPEIRVKLAGVDAAPLAEDVEDVQLQAWAAKHSLDPERALIMGEAAHKTLLAFIRKQNIWMERADGQEMSESLADDSEVYLFVSGTHVALKLVESGLVLQDVAGTGPYAELYAAAEQRARDKGRGLWAE